MLKLQQQQRLRRGGGGACASVILEVELGWDSFSLVTCICNRREQKSLKQALGLEGDVHDDDNDADDHEEDEAQDELVGGHTTHECAHLCKVRGRKGGGGGAGQMKLRERRVRLAHYFVSAP